jgi:hypothetical protein
LSRKNRYLGVISIANKSVRDPKISDQSGSEVNIYLFLYPKEVLHILKKERKRQVQKKPHKIEKKLEVPASFVSFVL